MPGLLPAVPTSEEMVQLLPPANFLCQMFSDPQRNRVTEVPCVAQRECGFSSPRSDCLRSVHPIHLASE